MLEKRIDEFIKYLKIELRYPDTTVTSYKRDLDNYYGFIKLKKINYKEITKDEIRDYLKYLDDLKYKKSTISRYLSSLRHFYDYLKMNNIIKENQFKNISNPKKDKLLPNFLNYEELETIFDSIDLTTPLGIRNRLIIELLYASGIRLSELTNLTLDKIDLKEQKLRVLGKGNKERITYFGEYALKYLNIYLNGPRDELLNGKKSNYLLINNNGGNLSNRGVEKIIDDVIKKASLKHNISPHTLRHTFATDLLNNGADIRSVQALLGHESISTTEIYTHVTNEHLRSVYLKSFPRQGRNK